MIINSIQDFLHDGFKFYCPECDAYTINESTLTCTNCGFAVVTLGGNDYLQTKQSTSTNTKCMTCDHDIMLHSFSNLGKCVACSCTEYKNDIYRKPT